MRYLAVLLVVEIICRVTSSSHHFQEIGGKYYYIEHYKILNWFDAREECRNMDAHLVSIQNTKEWYSITDHITISKSYWVDIRYDDSKFDWISDTSGKEAPFLMWSYWQPYHGDDYDCVKFWVGTRYMKTEYCSQENYYICEANSPPPKVHTPSSRYDIVDMKMQ